MDQSNLSADENIRRISDLLKTADRYVLAGEFDKASEQVDLVFALDPDNIYAKAYLKRIDVFKTKRGGDEKPGQEKDDASPEPKKQEEDKLKPPEPENDAEENQIVDKPAAGEETAETGTDHPFVQRQQAAEKLNTEELRGIVEKIISEEADLLDESTGEKEPVSQQESSATEKDPEILQQEENEAKYRETLKSLWKAGAVSDSNREKLGQLQSALGIPDERHAEIERSVKLEAYVNAVKEAWQDGLITPNGAAALDELRDKYRITIDEHLMIETRMMYELHGIRVKGVVMIIDDDVELVKIIKSILREEGYAPFSAHRPEHGLEILERTKPDLILLDVTFPKPSMSGFTTYEQIRKRTNLRFIPVVFLSGLDEEHIVQVGKKLGADDYITKPCSEQMLVSTIEGKIKRYKEMRKMLEKNQ